MPDLMTFEEIDEAYCRQLGLVREWVPKFEPTNGNESARILAVLERPGPMSIRPKGSGRVSQHNDDDTARNLKAQLAAAGISPADFCLTNIVAHVATADGKVAEAKVKGDELYAGAKRLEEIMAIMPNLKHVFLLGGKAKTGFRKHVRTIPAGVEVIEIWHTSRQGTGNGRNVQSKFHQRYLENLQAFSRVA